MLKALKELIEGGFLGQAIIATALVITSCFLVATGRMVPEWFVGLVATVVTWYFREQTAERQNRQELKRLAQPPK